MAFGALLSRKLIGLEVRALKVCPIEAVRSDKMGAFQMCIPEARASRCAPHKLACWRCAPMR